MTTIISFHLLGIDLSDFGTSEQERLLKDSLKMVTLKKFFHVLFHLTEDISFHLELINKSSFGMLKVTVSILSKSITIVIGFPRLDSFLLQPKLQSEVNSFPQSDGTDILRSGTIKPLILKTVLKSTMEALMQLLFHQEETLLSLEEKIKKLEFSIFQMLKSLPQAMMLDHLLTV
jgi:hypothetical protein